MAIAAAMRTASQVKRFSIPYPLGAGDRATPRGVAVYSCGDKVDLRSSPSIRIRRKLML